MRNRISFGSIGHVVEKLCVLNVCFLTVTAVFSLLFRLKLAGQVMQAFVQSMKFALSVLGYLNAFVVLTLFVVWLIGRENVFVAWVKALRYYYTLAYAVVLGIMAVGMVSFSSLREHINVHVLGFLPDMIKTILENKQFAAFTVILIAMVVIADLGTKKMTATILGRYKNRVPDGTWSWFQNAGSGLKIALEEITGDEASTTNKC